MCYWTDGLKAEFSDLDVNEQIEFLSWVHKNYPHRYDFATMSEPLRKFHNPDAKRGE